MSAKIFKAAVISKYKMWILYRASAVEASKSDTGTAISSVHPSISLHVTIAKIV